MRAAKSWGAVEKASRVGLRVGGPLVRKTKRGKGLPSAAAGKLPATTRDDAAAVYVPSCTNRILGRTAASAGEAGRNGQDALGLAEALVEVSHRARRSVWIPDEVAGSCCGLPWGSKGFGEAHRHKANEMVENLWGWSGEGKLPIVIDAASCTQAIADPGDGVLSEENAERLAKLEILDSVAWAHDHLLPQLEVSRKVGSGHGPPDLRDSPYGACSPPPLAGRRPRR